MLLIATEKAEDFLSELKFIQQSASGTTNQFANLSAFFHRLIKISTNEEQIAFRNFYARYRYLTSQIRLSDVERQNLDAFRRFIKAGEIKRINKQSIQQGIILLFKLINLLSDNEEDSDEISDLHYKDQYFSNLFPRRKYDQLKNLKVICSSWTEVISKNGSTGFCLKANDLENLEGQVEIFVRNLPHTDFTPFRDLLTENAILQFQNIIHIEKSGNQYSTTIDTLITLEPDFLVDATSIGECFNVEGSNSDIFFLSRIIDSLPGLPSLKGSIVGFYLDELMRNKKKNIDEIYKTAQRVSPLKAAQFGRTQMQGLKQSVHEEHLPNIMHLVKTQEKKEIWIEPTYFSKEYGLQGRIDLLGIDNKLDSKDIIELKSGSPSNHIRNIAWVNHKMQVVSYDMLLRSTYGADRQGTNAVYYSKCPVSPFRNIISEHDEKMKVLAIRNEITAKIYKIANGDFSLLSEIKAYGIPGIPGYLEKQLGLFREKYEPEKITTQYYQEMLAFILREMINAKVGDLLKEQEEECQNGFAGLWLDSMLTKEQDFRVISALRVTKIDENKGLISLTFKDTISHSFRKGDLIILYPKDGDNYDALKQQILKGSISELHLDTIVISLYNLQTNYSFINAYDSWVIEPDMFEKNFWSTVSCLFNVLNCSDTKKRLLFGHNSPDFDEAFSYSNPNLTENQNHVISQALNAKDYYLLQGPPGTGKTSTFLVNYAREVTAKTPDKIVVLAFTNKAVEKICESFKKPRNGSPIKYVRLGNKHVSDVNLFSELLTDENPDNWKNIINEHQIFVTTVATFQNNWLLLKSFMQFKQVIIDESSQLTEAALAGVLVLFEKFILIGDHKQLPSVVTQSEKTCLVNKNYLNRLGIHDLRISLFERLTRNAEAKGWDNAFGQLTYHYRMHRDIAALISDNYNEELIPSLAAQKSKTPPYQLPGDHPLSPLANSRIIFIESPAEISIKRNIKEAYLAAHIAQNLIDAGIVTPSQIGIITPFRAQISEIRKFIRVDLLKNEGFIIDTVERYQGDERKIIIFSSTITSARQINTIQSIACNDKDKTDRKLLVSISRASEQFIILGNSEPLMHASAYKELITRITAANGYLDGDFSDKILESKAGGTAR